MRPFLAILIAALSFVALASPAWAVDPLDQELAALVEAELPPGSEITVTDVVVRGTLPRGAYELDLRCDPTRTTNLRALVRTEDGRNQAWVIGKLDARVPTVILRSNVEAGQPVQDAIDTELRPVRDVPRDALDAQTLAEAVASRDLDAGDVLRKRDVKLPRLVERGRPVEVLVRRGNVVVSTRGIATQNGRSGDMVRVKTSQGQTLDTVVVGPQRTEVP